MLNQRFVIFFGFFVALILLSSVALVSTGRMKNSVDEIKAVIEEGFRVIDGVSRLRNVARERSVLLFEIIEMDDFFDRDEMLQVFHAKAREFIRVRDEIRNAFFTNQQKKIFDEALIFVRESSSAQNKAADYITNEKLGMARKVLVDNVVSSQRELQAKYDKLLEVLKNDVSLEFKKLDESTIKTQYFNTALTIISILPILLIAYFISKKIEKSEFDLKELNATLESKVKKRTADLNKANHFLEENIASLNDAQKHLVESEKLASLGSLVAGISHEINTPLGIGVTISSVLKSNIDELETKFETGKMKKSDMIGFIQSSNEGIDLLERNMKRAANLINDFKQVAVDQTSLQRRKYNLKKVVIEITETLHPQFKKTPHKVLIDIPDNIEMEGYPGPLGQVITNVALNALIHAFDENMEGIVKFTAHRNEEEIVLEVSDNGKGIPKENIQKVFKPFFTTRQGKGGSGIGMHIVQSVITEKLGGKIEVNSEVNKGTTLTFTLPPDAPILESA
jgi:signal transduction histidine kinase